MSLAAGFAASLAVLAAVIAAGGTRSASRLALALTLVLLPLPLFVEGDALPRILLAFVLAATFMHATEFAAGLAPRGARARLVYVLATFAFADATRVVRSAPSFDARSAAGLALGFGFAVLAAIGWEAAEALPAMLRYPLRLVCAAIGCLACVEFLESGVHLVTSALGFAVPRNFREPYLARSVGEFWGRRWNLIVVKWLRRNCFDRLRSRGAGLALFASFALSAAMHAYLMAPLGVAAAASMAGFFLAQPLFILAERRLGVRRWRMAAARAWTISALLVSLPLFLYPLSPLAGLSL